MFEIGREFTQGMWTKIKRFLPQWVMAVVLLTFASCYPDEAKTPAKLRIGVLPDQDAAILKSRYSPLISYLKTRLQTEVELVVPDTYQGLVLEFGSRKIDMGLFGGTTFVASLVRHDAVPLVLRDVDLKFSTYFVAAQANPSTKLRDFRDRRFSFGVKASTSGHLMPRHFMQQDGIEPEQFFSDVRYSGGHDKTIKHVLDGSIDLGAVNAEVVKTMLRDGRLRPGVLKIVWETPPYADYVWAVQSDMDQTTRIRLQDAFLALSTMREADARILEPMGTKGFLPARREDFTSLIAIMANLPAFRELAEKSDQ